jgi:hypothetical protein
MLSIIENALGMKKGNAPTRRRANSELVAAEEFGETKFQTSSGNVRPRLPRTSLERLHLARRSSDSTEEKPETLLYLAYGSNLCAETFQGKRGIKPLSAVNVMVPELDMVFDLPGFPYAEPCFANSRYRVPKGGPDLNSEIAKVIVGGVHEPDEASALLKDKLVTTSTKKPKFSNPEWHNGLVGVVYEVTQADYSHIIATEGGGSSYSDIEIKCFPLLAEDDTVPEVPNTPGFMAHTLFAGVAEPGSLLETRKRGRIEGWAQPSARYLKLITDGAAEHNFPKDYSSYLNELESYQIQSRRQAVGKFVFMVIWVPWVALMFFLSRKYTEKNGGKAPGWVIWLTKTIFGSMWGMYDSWFKWVFGEGERTIKSKDEQKKLDEKV